MFYIFVFKCIKKTYMIRSLESLMVFLFMPFNTSTNISFRPCFHVCSFLENFRTFCTLDKLLYTVELYTHIPKNIFNYYYYGRTEQIHRCVLFRNKLILLFGGFSISSNLHTKYDTSERKNFKLP